MRKSRFLAIVIGIVAAVAVGVAFAFTSTMPNNEQEVEPAGTTEGRNVVVNIEEKLGISEKP